MAIPEVKLNYKIRYRVQGWDKQYETPAYSEDEVEYQRADLAGYEGVYDVCVIPVHADDDQEVIG